MSLPDEARKITRANLNCKSETEMELQAHSVPPGEVRVCQRCLCRRDICPGNSSIHWQVGQTNWPPSLDSGFAASLVIPCGDVRLFQLSLLPTLRAPLWDSLTRTPRRTTNSRPRKGSMRGRFARPRRPCPPAMRRVYRRDLSALLGFGRSQRQRLGRCAVAEPTGRRREFTMRVALGVSPRRINQPWIGRVLRWRSRGCRPKCHRCTS